MRVGALARVRDFLVLAGGLAVVLAPVAGWGVHDGALGLPAAALLASAAAAGLALLGLFLTWGDGGCRVLDASRSLFVLLAFAAGLIALLLWNASTAGGGN